MGINQAVSNRPKSFIEKGREFSPLQIKKLLKQCFDCASSKLALATLLSILMSRWHMSPVELGEVSISSDRGDRALVSNLQNMYGSDEIPE